MTTKIKYWQWPNVLAIDASLIAIAWLWLFAEKQSISLSTTAYAVLGLSVWLTYISDRLFDVRPRKASQLLSTRHQFSKRNLRGLWFIWPGILFLNISIAITGLDQSVLNKGFVLLIICLTYSGLNHLLSKRFFPKEILVALIFAGGTQIFLPDYSQWQCLAGFTLLCLINCLVIGWKEKPVDAMLKVHSVASVIDRHWFYPILTVGIFISLLSSCSLVLLISYLALSILQFKHERFSKESFRVLCDAALIIGPAVYFFCSGVFVR